MPFDLPAEHVLPLLEPAEGGWKTDARAAWDWLTASGDAPVVGLYDLEYFLWYQLPAKFLSDRDHHVRVAMGLARLLDELGYEEAAALAQGPITMRVLAEWAASPSRGYRALNRALGESGVEPPDTDLLAWGTIMGLTEAAAFEMAAAALEGAMTEGRFTPGARGWKRAQAEVMREFLTTPRHALDERTPQRAIWDERQEHWACGPGRPLRDALVEGIREQVHRLPDPPHDVRDHLWPLLTLLEVAADDLRLTNAGYLPAVVVRQLTGEFGWWDWEGRPRGEADVPQVITMRAFAKEAGLVRTRDGRFGLTRPGKAAVSDPAALWNQVTGALAADHGFVGAIRELLLVRLLKGACDRQQIEAESFPVLSEAGWRPRDRGVLDQDMVARRLWDAIQPMPLLGMIWSAEWPDREIRLTEFGAISARAILWHRSTAPRRSIM